MCMCVYLYGLDLLSYIKGNMSYIQSYYNLYNNIFFCALLFFNKNSGNRFIFSVELSLIPVDGCGVLPGVFPGVLHGVQVLECFCPVCIVCLVELYHQGHG